MKLNRTYLKDFICKQKCLPWFIWERLRELNCRWKFLQCQFNLTRYTACHQANRNVARKAKISFLIPHKDGAECLKLCIESIQKKLKGRPYQILIADDGSNSHEFQKLLELASDHVSLYRFARSHGHGFTLEWLFPRVQSPFVVVLDQDSILLKSPEDLIKEFELNRQLLIIGMRDQCVLRHSRDMIHASFIMLHRERVRQVLRGPLFVGYNIPYGNLQVKQWEPYHNLTCKALAWDAQSILYLDTYLTKYGFGTVGYLKDIENVIAYHQWFSGRIFTYQDQELIEGISVKKIREQLKAFQDDYREEKADYRCLKLTSGPENYMEI